MEISVNGGAYTQLTPVGGYPKTFRRTRGGSRPAYVPTVGRPCWADTTTPVAWAMKEVDLSAYEGESIQIRFRFVSDSATHFRGFYIDDVVIMGALNVPSEPTTPIAVTISVSGSDLILRWNDDGNLFYRIYAASSASGPYETFADWWTASNSFTITGGASAIRKYYYVAGWDGN